MAIQNSDADAALFNIMPLRRGAAGRDSPYPLARWFFRSAITGDLSGGNMTVRFIPSEVEARKYLWGWDWVNVQATSAVIASLEWYMGQAGSGGVLVHRRSVDVVAGSGGSQNLESKDSALLPSEQVRTAPQRFGQTAFEWRIFRTNPGAGETLDVSLAGMLWPVSALLAPSGPLLP